MRLGVWGVEDLGECFAVVPNDVDFHLGVGGGVGADEVAGWGFDDGESALECGLDVVGF
jgi:hypothetical protein